MRYNNGVWHGVPQRGNVLKKRLISIAAAAVMIASAGLLGACSGIRENASVHDPSVFYDEASKTYYAFGSHFAVASSKDLVNWHQESRDGAEGQKLLYGTEDWREIVSQGDSFVGGNENTWAPDVEYHNGKYYMYYSLTSGFGSDKSAIGRVSSDSVLGPYGDDRIIVSYATTPLPETGSRPNCIDPELFYDKDGGLWMVYGSFFGGIFMLELETEGENWGIPKPDQGFGKRVWANPGEGAEGPFVFYHPETGYYYLIVSYGSLSSDYNMRVARSKSPDGPYEGVLGEMDVALYTSGTYKLAGNYIVGDAQGYAAIGHCSVAEKDGEYFIVAHSRRQDEATGGVTGAHEMFVAKLLFNKDGWPVMSPCRYTGEKTRTFTAEELAGTYDVIVQNAYTSAAFVQSEALSAADGKIFRGEAEAGAVTLTDGKYVTITLDGTTYEGVVAECTQTYAGGGKVICMSAVSYGNASTIWLIGQ